MKDSLHKPISKQTFSRRLSRLRTEVVTNYRLFFDWKTLEIYNIELKKAKQYAKKGNRLMMQDSLSNAQYYAELINQDITEQTKQILKQGLKIEKILEYSTKQENTENQTIKYPP